MTDLLPTPEQIVALSLYNKLNDGIQYARSYKGVNPNQIVIGIDTFEDMQKVFKTGLPKAWEETGYGPVNILGCRLVVDNANITGTIYYGRDLITLH